MRSDRLTRKSHFRRLSVRDMGAGQDEFGVIDLSLESDNDLQHNHEILSLADVQAEAARVNAVRGPETVQEQPSSFQTERDALVWCARMIEESPTARLLWVDAEKRGWSVGFSDLKNQGFCMDTADRVILLDHFSLVPSALGRSAFFRHVMLTTFIRALRDVWHEERVGAPEQHFSPEYVLMMERVRAADCDTVTILCGWELRGAGFSEVWRHLLGSEEGDMAIIFTRFLERDPGSLFTGAALAYAFRQWYADVSRVDGVDHDTLEALDNMMQEVDGAITFGQNRLTAAFLEDLATLPDGKRYLAGLGEGIIRDPFFAGLNDAINQTHLFHLMYDMEVVMVNNVPFRDSRLARKIFPQGDITRVK